MSGINRREFLGVGAAGLGAAASLGFTDVARAAPMLAPRVSKASFARLLAEMRAVVGDAWVYADDQGLRSYKKSYTPDPQLQHVPVGAVAPQSVEEVQAIVRIANHYRQPIWTVSTGKNMGYGSATPATPGQMVLDLKRMNRILNVDPDLATALVEPGVTYQQLQDYLDEHKIPLWLDVPTIGPIASPVGNTLDRGVGYTPYGDHFMFQCGMEVVLPNGEVMRTGMGALPGAKTWQEYRHGFGPDPAGLFFQGNFGIVTKIGVRLMPLPEHYRTGKITVPRRQDLHGLVRTVNYLADLFMIGEPVFSSPLHPLMKNSEFVAEATRQGAFNDEKLDQMAAAAKLPFYQVELQFYGSEGTTKANWDYAQQLAVRNVPGARALEGVSFPMPLTREQIMDKNPPYGESAIRRYAAVAVPNLTTFDFIGRHVENPDDYVHLHYGMFTIVPRSAEAVFQVQRAWVDLVHEEGATLVTEQTPRPSVLTMPLQWHQTCFFMWAGFPLQAEGRPMSEALARMLELVLDVNAKNGWCEYRAEPLMQDKVAEYYGFNNHVLRRFNEALKDAVDPNGILSPGRGGIWPKAFRSLRGKVGV